MTEEKVVKLSGSEEYSVTGTCLKDIEVRTFESKTTWIENGVERLNYKKLVIDEMVDEGSRQFGHTVSSIVGQFRVTVNVENQE